MDYSRTLSSSCHSCPIDLYGWWTSEPGAGIPGMPLRIIDERIEVTLIESKRKRVSFLKTLRRELGLEKSVAVEEGRAEALVSEVLRRDGAFDVAVARAVGNLEQVVPTALQYLKPGGVFIVSAPPPARLAGLERGIAREVAHLGLP